MARRELRIVATDEVVGAVVVEASAVRFEGAAATVFAWARSRESDAELGAELLDEGWSNGYLYLGDRRD